MNSIIDLIQNRASCPKLSAPGPTSVELEQILFCAMRAPDHARLKPWHYHVLTGEALDQLGEVFVSTIDDESSSAARLEKCRNMPKRAPLMVVAVCEPMENAKVPVMEQILAVGAGIQNMQIAISSLGYGSIWRTGDMAHAKAVKDHFGVSSEGEIVGFLYVGTPEKKPNVQMPNLSKYVKYWD